MATPLKPLWDEGQFILLFKSANPCQPECTNLVSKFFKKIGESLSTKPGFFALILQSSFYLDLLKIETPNISWWIPIREQPKV